MGNSCCRDGRVAADLAPPHLKQRLTVKPKHNSKAKSARKSDDQLLNVIEGPANTHHRQVHQVADSAVATGTWMTSSTRGGSWQSGALTASGNGCSLQRSDRTVTIAPADVPSAKSTSPSVSPSAQGVSPIGGTARPLVVHPWAQRSALNPSMRNNNSSVTVTDEVITTQSVVRPAAGMFTPLPLFKRPSQALTRELGSGSGSSGGVGGNRTQSVTWDSTELNIATVPSFFTNSSRDPDRDAL